MTQSNGARARRWLQASPQNLGRTVVLAVLSALALFFLVDHLKLSLGKEYSVDEYQYAHGGWLIAQGQVIYRDFFEHHFPLVHQLAAGVFWLLGDDPNNILYLRLLMVSFWLLILFSAAQLNGELGTVARVLTLLVVLLVPTHAMMVTEIRPDVVAFALFFAALAVLAPDGGGSRWRSFASGVLLVAACWGTLKVAYYGLIFPAALVADLVVHRPRGQRCLLGSPFAFLGGVLAGALPIGVYLTITRSWADWFAWCIEWSFVHQRHYPGFVWLPNFWQLFGVSFWLFPLAAVGVVKTMRGVAASEGLRARDLLLLAGLVTSFLSFAWQSAPYLYSLIPFTGFLCVFAARGILVLVSRFATRGGSGVFVLILACLLLTVESQRSHRGMERLLETSNEKQHALWRLVATLTRPDEPVFHIHGGQIARPSVHYFYFKDSVVRKLFWDTFENEMPRSLAEKGCIAYLPEPARFPRLPKTLQAFLLRHYQPHSEGFWLWGMGFAGDAAGAAEPVTITTAGAAPLAGTFLAPRAGRYFAWSHGPIESDALRIDGEIPAAPAFELERGVHRFEYSGSAGEIWILWLPADGALWEPRPELQEPYIETYLHTEPPPLGQ
jgi:hypothetical protein